MSTVDSREGDEFNIACQGLRLLDTRQRLMQITRGDASRDPVLELIKRMAVDTPESSERRNAAAVLLRAVNHLRRRGSFSDPRILSTIQLAWIIELLDRSPMLGQTMYRDTLSAIHDLLAAGHKLQPQRDVLSRLESLAEALLEVHE